MDIHGLIKTRRSVRAYQDRPIPMELLERILESARWAPSARNLQPWKLVVVKDPERRRRLALAAREQMFIAEAPVVVVAVALDPERIFTCGVPGYPIDVSIAMDHLSLAATGEGLGTCWVAAFDQDRVAKVVDLPPGQKVVVLMPMGYPADEPGERTRKPLAELVAYESAAPTG
ncbi:MAG: nitroreductase family protein [Gemmatimonadota bacterium]